MRHPPALRPYAPKLIRVQAEVLQAEVPERFRKGLINGAPLQRCLEWGGYREEIFEVAASEEALRELPQHLWVEGRQVSAPDQQAAARLVANKSA